MPRTLIRSDSAGKAAWCAIERWLAGLAVLNLLAALVVGLLGAALHPMFSDPDAALLFLVTGLTVTVHVVVLAAMRRQLSEPAGARPHALRQARSFMRLPLAAEFAPARRTARLRMRGRPLPRPHPPSSTRPGD